jgi:hypothetical protein
VKSFRGSYAKPISNVDKLFAHFESIHVIKLPSPVNEGAEPLQQLRHPFLFGPNWQTPAGYIGSTRVVGYAHARASPPSRSLYSPSYRKRVLINEITASESRGNSGVLVKTNLAL